MITKSKQSWEVGQQVKVGFLSGLTVLAKIPTPGDSAPDAYILGRGASVYSFVPHNGLSKITQDEAREMVASARRVAERNEAHAAAAAAATIQAAQFAAEIMRARA